MIPKQEDLSAAYEQFDAYAVNRVRNLVQLHGLDNMRSAFLVFGANIDLAILKVMYPTISEPTPNGDFYEDYKYASSNWL